MSETVKAGEISSPRCFLTVSSTQLQKSPCKLGDFFWITKQKSETMTQLEYAWSEQIDICYCAKIISKSAPVRFHLLSWRMTTESDLPRLTFDWESPLPCPIFLPPPLHALAELLPPPPCLLSLLPPSPPSLPPAPGSQSLPLFNYKVLNHKQIRVDSIWCILGHPFNDTPEISKFEGSFLKFITMHLCRLWSLGLYILGSSHFTMPDGEGGDSWISIRHLVGMSEKSSNSFWGHELYQFGQFVLWEKLPTPFTSLKKLWPCWIQLH